MAPEEAKVEFIRQAKENKRVEFFGRMYGTSNKTDKIINMHVYEDSGPFGLDFTQVEDWKCFTYIWGWPGPDYNNYYFRDYGETWAFSMEDFKE